jgi:hypothetical protein
MIEIFPDERIVATLSQQLSWSHFELIPIEDPPETRVLRGNVPGGACGRCATMKRYKMFANQEFSEPACWKLRGPLECLSWLRLFESQGTLARILGRCIATSSRPKLGLEFQTVS